MALRRVPVASVRLPSAEPTGGAARAEAHAQARARGMPRWLAVRSRVELFSLLEAAAPNAVVRFAVGDVDHVLVGGIVRDGPRVVIAPWAATAEIVVPLSSVSGISPVPAHSFSDESLVRRRQRCGEPALVLPRRKRTQSASEEP